MSQKQRKPSAPETVIRVKLPDSGAFSSGPSGDTEFEIAYRKAISAAMPAGWRLAQMRSNYRYAVDSDGMTILRVEPEPPTDPGR